MHLSTKFCGNVIDIQDLRLVQLSELHMSRTVTKETLHRKKKEIEYSITFTGGHSTGDIKPKVRFLEQFLTDLVRSNCK